MVFEDADGKTILIYYEINNLGHRILVSPGNNKYEGGKTGTYGTDRGFHSTWQTAKDFGLINE